LNDEGYTQNEGMKFGESETQNATFRTSCVSFSLGSRGFDYSNRKMPRGYDVDHLPWVMLKYNNQ